MPKVKRISLSNGGFALVSRQDYLRISSNSWHLYKSPLSDTLFYARRKLSNGKFIFMHREILGTKQGDIDHINGNGLDNRRNNLRPCTRQENLRNKKKYKNNQSGFKGVWKATDRQKQWRACVVIDNKKIYAGAFETPEEAAIAYDQLAKRYFGEFARPNFN